MSEREPHWVEATKGNAYPVRLYALDCESTSCAHPSRPGWQVETLSAWEMNGWSRDHHGKEKAWHGAGTDQAGLWSAIQWGLRRGSVTWIVSYGAARIWGLAGLWEMIESGKVVLRGEETERRRIPGAEAGPVPGVQEGDPEHGAGSRRRAVGGLPEVLARAHGGWDSRSADGGGNRPGRPDAIIEDPPTVIVVRVPGVPGTLQLLDVRNYGIECFPFSRPLGERVGWLADTMRRMIQTLQAQEWGSLQLTAASQAMYTWRRSFLNNAVHCHADPDALPLERSAYVGGRCEAWRIGTVEGPIYHADVRSLYPWVCAVSSVPTVLRRTGTGSVLQMPERVDSPLGIIAEVKVQTEEPAYPATLARPTVYPIGTFWTCLAGPELSDAIERGRVIKVGRWSEYHLAPALADYACAVYQMRRRAEVANDEPLTQWLKRLSVAIVGKFGQRGLRWLTDESLYPPAPWILWYRSEGEGEVVRCRALGWQTQREANDDWSYNSAPAIAAWICSAGRMRLLEGIRIAGWSEVYYHDTDSLMVSERGYDRLCSARLVHDDRFGAWRLVGVADKLQMWGQKHYRLGERLVCAGLPRGTVQTTDDPALFWYRDWLKRAVSQGHRPEVMRMLLTYARSGAYKAGSVGPEGRVQPWRKSE